MQLALAGKEQHQPQRQAQQHGKHQGGAEHAQGVETGLGDVGPIDVFQPLGHGQDQSWRGGFTPLSSQLPTTWYFQRTGSCSVCTRALRQWRSKLCFFKVERVPPSSNSLLLASMAISVVSTLARATAREAWATLSSFGAGRAASRAKPARSNNASAASRRISRAPT